MGPLPQHGFARTSLWTVGGVNSSADAGAQWAEVTLVLSDSEATRKVGAAARMPKCGQHSPAVNALGRRGRTRSAPSTQSDYRAL
jgi:hypothetical protein